MEKLEKIVAVMYYPKLLFNRKALEKYLDRYSFNRRCRLELSKRESRKKAAWYAEVL